MQKFGVFILVFSDFQILGWDILVILEVKAIVVALNIFSVPLLVYSPGISTVCMLYPWWYFHSTWIASSFFLLSLYMPILGFFWHNLQVLTLFLPVFSILPMLIPNSCAWGRKKKKKKTFVLTSHLVSDCFLSFTYFYNASNQTWTFCILGKLPLSYILSPFSYFLSF